MKLSSAIEGGLAGATTISLLGQTLRKINGDSSHVNVFNGKNLKKRFKKAKSKKPLKATKQFIGLAGDLLGSTAFLGLKPLNKRKNAVLRGALLGTAAGLGSVLLDGHRGNKETFHGENGHSLTPRTNDSLTRALEVGLYAVGGMIAGKLVQRVGKKRKRK
jgi:hypothetical protein